MSRTAEYFLQEAQNLQNILDGNECSDSVREFNEYTYDQVANFDFAKQFSQ